MIDCGHLCDRPLTRELNLGFKRWPAYRAGDRLGRVAHRAVPPILIAALACEHIECSVAWSCNQTVETLASKKLFEHLKKNFIYDIRMAAHIDLQRGEEESPAPGGRTRCHSRARMHCAIASATVRASGPCPKIKSQLRERERERERERVSE